MAFEIKFHHDLINTHTQKKPGVLGRVTNGEFLLKPKNQSVIDVAGAKQFSHSLNKEVLGKVLNYSKVGDIK